MLHVLLILLASSAVAGDCRPIDLAQSTVGFAVEQGDSLIEGRFGNFGGEVCMDADRVTRIDMWLAPASITTGMPEADAALQGEDFFAVDEYARATYHSDSIAARDGGYRVTGALRIRNVERVQAVPFELHRQDGMLRLQGEFMLNRLDFDVGTGELKDTFGVADEVMVRFDLMAGAAD